MKIFQIFPHPFSQKKKASFQNSLLIFATIFDGGCSWEIRGEIAPLKNFIETHPAKRNSSHVALVAIQADHNGMWYHYNWICDGLSKECHTYGKWLKKTSLKTNPLAATKGEELEGGKCGMCSVPAFEKTKKSGISQWISSPLSGEWLNTLYNSITRLFKSQFFPSS